MRHWMAIAGVALGIVTPDAGWAEAVARRPGAIPTSVPDNKRISDLTPAMSRALLAAPLLGAARGESAGAGGSTTTLPDGAYSCQASFPGADGGAGMLALCLEVLGGSAQDLANNRQQCETQGNTFVLAPCPVLGVLPSAMAQALPRWQATAWPGPAKGGGCTGGPGGPGSSFPPGLVR